MSTVAAEEPEPDKPHSAASGPSPETPKMTRYGAISTEEEPLPVPPPVPPPPVPPTSSPSKFNSVTGALRSSTLPKRRRTKEERQIYEDSIKGFMDALLSNSSLLAISNIVKRNHPVLKTLWAIALCLCLVLSIRQLYSLTRTYLGHPKSTTIELSYKPFDFPSVTVCNHNPLRRTRVALSERPDLSNFLADLLSRNYSVADNGTQLMTQQNDWLRFHKLISNRSIEDRLGMGYQFGDFILQCNFAGKKCDPGMFGVSLSKTYGNCFTFNGWQSARGFERPVAKNGREHGLIMTLYLELEEYLVNFIPSAGVKVQLHEPGSMAFPEYSGFSVPPGFQSSIGVSLKMITRLDHQNDHCDDGEKFYAKYGIKYTFSACMTRCKHEQVRDKCGCYDLANRLFYGADADSMQPCRSEEQLSCMMKVEYLGEEGDLNCGCPLPCRESYYKYGQSLSEWPTDSYEARLFGDLIDVKPKISRLKNESKILARRNLLNLLVYMDGLMTEHVIEKNSYAVDNYLSDIGGTLGLFLGFSVLTGFELLEASALVLAYICGKIIYREEDEESTGILSPAQPGSPPSSPRPVGGNRRSSRIASLAGAAPQLHPG